MTTEYVIVKTMPGAGRRVIFGEGMIFHSLQLAERFLESAVKNGKGQYEIKQLGVVK